MNKRVMLLGAGGQLGQHFSFEAEKVSSLNVIAFRRDRLDISDFQEVDQAIESLKPDFVVNCAAYTNVDGAEDHAQQAMLVNAESVRQLGISAQKHRATLVHVSTDYVFDGQKNTPYLETDPCAPLGVYGQTKRKGEQWLEELDAPAIIIRTSWLYSYIGQNFFNTMKRLGQERDKLNVVYDQVGTPTYAKHLAQAMIHIMLQGFVAKQTSCFHYANEGVCSWYDFARKIMQQAGNGCEVFPILSHEFPTKTQRPAYSVLHKGLMKKTFNLSIPHWEEGVVEAIKQR